MKNYKTKWWELNIPENWMTQESRDDRFFITNNDDRIKVFSLVSSYEDISREYMQECAEKIITSESMQESIRIGKFDGIKISKESNETSTQEIFLRYKNLMLIITIKLKNNAASNLNGIVQVLSGLRPLNSEIKI